MQNINAGESPPQLRTIAEARRLQMGRLDEMREALMKKAKEGDVSAVSTIIKCDDQETKILTTDDGGGKPVKYVVRWQGEKDAESPPQPARQTESQEKE
jgi:hypothetical protein